MCGNLLHIMLSTVIKINKEWTNTMLKEKSYK